MRSEIVVQINYPGGPYLLNPRRLAAGETVIYDLRKIRDEQIPDNDGHTIPLSVTGGQFRWFIHGPGSGRLIGRAEMLSQSKGISSSYSCPGSSCPPQFSYATLVPGDVYLAPGDFVTERPQEVDCDTYFNCTPPFTPYVTSWEVTDLYGAVEYYNNGDTMDLVGFNGGTAYIRANIGYERYYWEELTSSCQDEGMDTGYVDGQARVVHINSISPTRGPVGITVPVTISGGWFDQNSTPTVHVSGYGVTIADVNVISTGTISANFNITGDATAGNHSVTVISHGITSNGVNFFVQAPTTFAPISLSPANLGCASTAGGYGGQVLYGVLDQNGQTMAAAGYTPQEHFTQNGTPAFGGFRSFATPPTTDSNGRFLDTPVGTCFDPAPSSNVCVDIVQTFNIVVGSFTYSIPTVTTRRDCVQGVRVTVTNGGTSQTASLGTVN